MIQFLKSILFGDKETLHKINELREDVFFLKARVIVIEEEMKSSLDTISDLSVCLKSISEIVADLSNDMNAVSLWMQAQAIKELKELNEKRNKKDPLSLSLADFSDDDDELVN